MRKRDLAILNNLHRFRCMTRDDIIALHFNDLKNPVTCANTVLKRLRRDGYIEVNMNHQPYLYFPSPSPIKKDSTKIPHFLRIVDFYKEVRQHEEPKIFTVEPKYGKKGECMEPDGFMIWKRGPFFVEIQRNLYSEKVMNEKVKRYESYYFSNEWQNEPWQPVNKKVFPPVILVTDTRYSIESPYIRFIQVQNINELLSIFEPESQKNIQINCSLKLKSI